MKDIWIVSIRNNGGELIGDSRVLAHFPGAEKIDEHGEWQVALSFPANTQWFSICLKDDHGIIFVEGEMG